jgi:Immunity protein 53
MALLSVLSHWYAHQCDGDWEHEYGISIQTIDNPGWSLSIDLHRTPLSDSPFADIAIERSADDWVCCRIEAEIFKGFGGPANLEELITLFLDWADEQERSQSARHLDVPVAG